MNFNLSAEITLENIPERYYHMADMIEALRQQRFEKIRTYIQKSQQVGSIFAAQSDKGEGKMW